MTSTSLLKKETFFFVKYTRNSLFKNHEVDTFHNHNTIQMAIQHFQKWNTSELTGYAHCQNEIGGKSDTNFFLNVQTSLRGKVSRHTTEKPRTPRSDSVDRPYAKPSYPYRNSWRQKWMDAVVKLVLIQHKTRSLLICFRTYESM